MRSVVYFPYVNRLGFSWNITLLSDMAVEASLVVSSPCQRYPRTQSMCMVGTSVYPDTKLILSTSLCSAIASRRLGLEAGSVILIPPTLNV